MIIAMELNSSTEDAERVLQFIDEHGLNGRPSCDGERTFINVLGMQNVVTENKDGSLALTSSLENFPGIERVIQVSRPYRLASREFHPHDTHVSVPVTCVPAGSVKIGGMAVAMMAGPCTVESEKQLMTTAQIVRQEGAVILRGGAYKPSTSPYGFRGLGERGLKLLAKARAEFGMAVVTEVLTPADVPLVAEYADILQIGTRNMQNYALLEEAGRTKKPVLLKRGWAATIEEWLLAAEYILLQGNADVILCERGIRTFEKSTRNTLDISAIPLIKQLSHLPIVSDPSQGTGRRDIVIPMSLASVAASADGLLVEVHPDPANALKDGAQSLSLQEFQHLMTKVRPVAEAIGRTMTA